MVLGTYLNRRFIVKAALFTACCWLFSYLRVSFLVGSTRAYFSGTGAILPLSGAFGGIGFASFLSLIRLIVGWVKSGSLSLHIAALCVPGYFASLYWSSSRVWIRLFVPLVCIALFVLNPVGRQAWLYSMYWMIPVALFFFKKKNAFLTALGSTFVAHGVGSVLWLYSMPMVPAMWYALIPVVFVERMLFAGVMTLAEYVLSATFSWVLRRKKLLFPFSSKLVVAPSTK